jgi:RimJ/RimL family protein N-acetyltransferase
MELLEGRIVNLRIVEKEDLQAPIAEWNNNPEFYGEYAPLYHDTKAELEKVFGSTSEKKYVWFMIEKKDRTKVGIIGYFLEGECLEIGYALLPNERKKGYCTEAIKIIVDFLFLSKDIMRVQADTDVRNLASQRVLEKAGFTKEGVLRKSAFIRGEWRDAAMFSILRDDWKEPKILTKTG